MRKKRKKKNQMFKMYTKVLISLLVCLSLVLTTVKSSNHNEASAVSSLTQPINIMYSLLTQKDVNQYEEMSGSFTHKYYYFQHLKTKIDIEKDKQMPDTEETKEEAEKAIEKNKDKNKDKNVQHKPVEKTPQATNSNSAKQENAVGEKPQKIIYLTFDDGPSPYTLDILESLNNFEMKATFFMLEPNMRTYQKQLHAIIDEGHTPALHGVTHTVSKIYRSEKTVVDEMAKAQSTLMKLTGTGTTLIRTPYGSSPYMKPSYKKAVKDAGFQLWDWTVDSEDWKFKNGEFVKKSIGQIENFRYKDRPIVILMHDRKTTAEHLPELLTYLKAKGYSSEVLTQQMTAFHF